MDYPQQKKKEKLSKQTEHNTDKKKESVKYMKYKGMAAQMGGTIILGVLLGQWLDSYFGTEKAIYTGICALLFTVAAMYFVLKDFIKPS